VAREERIVDKFARDIAITKYALPVSVHIPVAAKEEVDITKYIGRIVDVLVPGIQNRALLVEPYYTPKKDDLPIWQLPESEILHYPQQVWVHVDYTGYKNAYLKAFGKLKYRGYVLDHVMNRRVARLKYFTYLRIVPISREANSSSGGLCEKWAVEYHSSLQMQKTNLESPARIQYADLADIVKMLNLKTGGSLQYPVNEAQALVRYP
jgi:hypothetical protein